MILARSFCPTCGGMQQLEAVGWQVEYQPCIGFNCALELVCQVVTEVSEVSAQVYTTYQE
jgi:hypothetical protein